MGPSVLVREGKKMAEQWLRCSVLKGMFSDELAIVYEFKQNGGKPEKSSFFVPRDKVVESEGKVRVRVVRQGDTAWAILPTENQAMIPIDEADLTMI